MGRWHPKGAHFSLDTTKFTIGAVGPGIARVFAFTTGGPAIQIAPQSKITETDNGPSSEIAVRHMECHRQRLPHARRGAERDGWVRARDGNRWASVLQAYLTYRVAVRHESPV